MPLKKKKDQYKKKDSWDTVCIAKEWGSCFSLLVVLSKKFQTESF